MIHHKDWNIDEEITGRVTPPGLVIDGTQGRGGTG